MPTHRITVPAVCQGCGQDFIVRQDQLNQGKGKYCSRECSYEAKRKPHMPILDRFWSKVDKSGDCWVWKDSTKGFGYGIFAVTHGKQVGAHRFSWEIHNGPIPEGLEVCHKCDNPPCVNPDHLFLGTHTENLLDMHAKGRGARGDRHGARTKPESIKRGEQRSTLLTWTDVDEIRRRYAAGGVYLHELGAEFGISKENVYNIVHFRTWAKR
jgi:hypothetical protein